MNRDGTNARLISAELDRDVEEPKWSQDGGGLYFQYDDQGSTKIGFIARMDARPTQLVAKVAHVLKWFEKYRTDTKEK